MLEIERKFLVVSRAYRDHATSRRDMVHGFLSTDPERTIRVRRSGEKAWMTIKGLTTESGTTRREWEYEIPPEDAEALLALCPDTPIRKTRYEVPLGHHVFEVDEFRDANEGLVLAEVELQRADEAFTRPEWLGEEVTGNPAYYNSQLSIKPYTTWND